MNAQTLNHPTHGPLTIGDKLPGTRTYTCTREDGTEVRLSSREINKHTRSVPERDPLVSIVEAVRVTLAAMPDTVDRVRVAKEIWHLADQYVEEKIDATA